MCWNARSIVNKTAELVDFIYTRNIGIASICETHLSPNCSFKINGYKIYRSDRNRFGGGVALIISDNINHYQVTTPSLNSAEAVAIKIIGFDEFVFVSTYVPRKLLESDILSLCKLHKRVCIAGDINARHEAWNCFGNNQNGKILLNTVLNNNLLLVTPDEPTFLPSNSDLKPSIIDIFVTKNLYNISKPYTVVDLRSDHVPVIATIDAAFEKSTPNLVYNFKKGNWEIYQDFLNKNIPVNPTIASKKDIDDLIKKLNDCIFSAADIAIPKKAIKPHFYKIPKNIQKLIKIKNYLRKKCKATTFKSLKPCVNKLNSLIPKLINIDKNKKWTLFLGTLSPKDNSLWKVNKYFTKQKNDSTPPLVTKQSIAFSSLQKAEALADNFESVHKQNLNLSSTYYTNQVHKVIRETFAPKIEKHNDCESISPNEVKTFIKKLKNKKAPGGDKITPLLIKNLPNSTVVFITLLFNYMLLYAYFPTEWKIANVVALPKPGKDHTDPKSYRPISLLCTFSKIFEKIIQRRLLSHIRANNLLSDMQFGFRSERSTVTQLFRVLDSITHNFNLNKHTGMVLLDIEKAFDCVWIKGLIYNLIILKFPLYLIYLLYSYLSDRKFYVVVNGVKSSVRSILAGVPQGSVLGPLMFILYIDKIVTILKNNVNLAAFADDTIAYKHSYRIDTIVNHLQITVVNCLRFFHKWKIRANESKTEAIIFTKRHPSINKNMIVNNKTIDWSDSVKYLGVLLDSRLTFTKHIDTQCNKAIGILVKLFPLLNRKSNLNIKNKLLLYKSIIRPVLTYAAPVWSNTCATNYKKLQVVQNKCLRVIGDFSRSTPINIIHDKLCIVPIKEYILNLTIKFCDKTSNSKDNFIKSITNYNSDSLHYKKYKHKRIKDILL